MKDSAQSVLAGFFLWMVVAATLAAAPIETKKPDGTPNRAAWMAQGTFGIMTHYLITPKGSTPQERTADLNRIVDQFDLVRYMKQFDETGADWLIFTLGQGTGYLSSRNDFIDRLEGGFTPHRDLIGEIGKQLKRRGKRLIVYLPGAHTGADPMVKRLLGLGTDGLCGPAQPVHPRLFRQTRPARQRVVVRLLQPSGQCGVAERDGRLQSGQRGFRHCVQRG